jgi:diacylglycerol diphosphate phosphatase / phosphatidate phosphatase
MPTSNAIATLDLISRCLPSPGLKDSPVWGLSNYTICTQVDEYILRDGFRSFPSGHASLSFAGLGFLSFYLVGKFRLWDERGYTVSS